MRSPWSQERTRRASTSRRLTSPRWPVSKYAAASGLAAGALIFLPLWLVGAGINLYLGVKTAGYSVREELPIFLLVFAIPAVAALLAWWKLR